MIKKSEVKSRLFSHNKISVTNTTVDNKNAKELSIIKSMFWLLTLSKMSFKEEAVKYYWRTV